MLIRRLKNLLKGPLSAAGPDGGGSAIPLLFPIGHFYSPIADPEDIRARQDRIWAPVDTMPGIDMRVESQLALLAALKAYTGDIEWPVEQPAEPTRYFYGNDQYPVLDAEFLYAALRHFRPKSMIEVGSGFSSLITAEVNRTHFGGALDFSCIEPYPRQFLIDGVEGITRLVRQKVEDVELAFFDRLGAGDFLFIDSSHVSKVGSDVNYLFFEVLPRLRPGVIVHIHDIFLPDEYPKVWVIDQGRNWNEQYLVRAFLQFNFNWDVLWAAHFMGTRHTEAVQRTFPRFPSLGGGGSLWLRRHA
jgi:predicted O-methyltransferase YrrM